MEVSAGRNPSHLPYRRVPKGKLSSCLPDRRVPPGLHYDHQYYTMEFNSNCSFYRINSRCVEDEGYSCLPQITEYIIIIIIIIITYIIKKPRALHRTCRSSSGRGGGRQVTLVRILIIKILLLVKLLQCKYKYTIIMIRKHMVR